MDALEALRTRRSIRSFKPDTVPAELVEQIIDCGRLAATARNVQPWEFVVVTDARLRKQIAQISEYGKFIEYSPVCIVVLCADTKYFLEDGSAATQNILVAAHAVGLGSCWVAGDKKNYAPEICKLVGAPPDLKLISLVAIGYTAEEKPIRKRDLKEVIHWEQF